MLSNPFIVDTLSGLVGAACLVAVGNPFDAAKLRLQTQPKLYSSPLDCMAKMVKSEGLKSLWKGSGPALLSSAVENAVLFASNGALRRLLVSVNGTGDEASVTPWQQGLIGAASGVLSATAICPAEVVKCRLQHQHAKGQYRGTADAFASILRQEGPAGLFSGLTALLARDIPFNAIFWSSYRGYCSLLHSMDPSYSSSSGLMAHEDVPGWMALTAGSLAGATAWAVVFPFDVLKSRAQVAGMLNGTLATGVAAPSFNIVAGFRSILSEPQGFRVLYRGASAAIARGCFANGALFFGQNMALKAMRKNADAASAATTEG